ncbi:MAG TPA: polyprenyl synthetase family protein [Nitrososphaerales archaeon]|nr:polyprenyl synthetase family protein [Nitrososphaerales archaeon]
MSTLDSEIKKVKSEVDRLILDELLPSSSPIPEVELLYKMMRDYPSRPAKGFRPFLCVTVCRAAGGSREDSLLTAACIELFQHWILIHDDIEDESELRRGQPTLHLKYSRALALNAGDALHAKMWGVLLSNERRLGQEKTLNVLGEFARMVGYTTEGQHMELGWVREKRWDLGESDYFDMCTRKTSWYTVASPCRLGAMVAGSGPGTLESLKEFGIKLGVGFQIQDDSLNLIGDQGKYGKAKSDDILEGKRTLILLHALGKAEAAERAKATSIMDKERGHKTGEDVAYVLGLIDKYRSIEYSQRRARDLMEEALAVLNDISWGGEKEAASLLESFSRFAVERQW